MKKIVIVSVFFLLSFSHLIAGKSTEIFQVGEKLTYKVTYMGINLGEVTVNTHRKGKFDGQSIFHISGEIKSNPGIPFASIHQVLKSKVHKSSKYTMHATAKMQEDDKWRYDTLHCEYGKNKMIFLSFLEDSLMERKEYKVKRAWNDGISLFFLARTYLDSEYKIRVPTFMGVDTASTHINFSNKTESLEIENFDKPIKTKYLSGKADWEGPYGLQGGFEGWFSDDEAHIPIIAKVKVIVGKVRIELTDWQRDGWSPPVN